MKVFEQILLIDDDEINNFINETILRSKLSSIKITAYTDPLKALNYLLDEFIKNPVHSLIFLDINMPQLTGWELLEKLINVKSDITNYLTIYMISSSIDTSDIEQSKQYSLVKDFVSKPLSKEFVQKLLN